MPGLLFFLQERLAPALAMPQRDRMHHPEGRVRFQTLQHPASSAFRQK